MVFTNVGSAFSRKTICLTFMGLVCIVEMPDYREYTKEVQDRSKEKKEICPPWSLVEIWNTSHLYLNKVECFPWEGGRAGYKRNILPSLIVPSCTTSAIYLQITHRNVLLSTVVFCLLKKQTSNCSWIKLYHPDGEAINTRSVKAVSYQLCLACQLFSRSSNENGPQA